jgi:hypothetical protein
MENTFKVGNDVRFCKETHGAIHLTVGKTYQVLDVEGDFIYVINELGNKASYACRRFELADNSIEGQIQMAKSFVGKAINDKRNNRVYVPDSIGLATIYTENGFLKNSAIENDGYAVYVENRDYVTLIGDVELLTNVIKLTDDYNATINKDSIEVGCQTIPIEKVKELLEKWEALHG